MSKSRISAFGTVYWIVQYFLATAGSSNEHRPSEYLRSDRNQDNLIGTAGGLIEPVRPVMLSNFAVAELEP
jgi:hypothetical protein